MGSNSLFRRAALLGLALLLSRGSVHVQSANPDTGSLKALSVSFKLDPRLQNSTYGGERRVSTPTFTGANAQDTVETRAQGVDARGQQVKSARNGCRPTRRW